MSFQEAIDKIGKTMNAMSFEITELQKRVKKLEDGHPKSNEDFAKQVMDKLDIGKIPESLSKIKEGTNGKD